MTFPTAQISAPGLTQDQLETEQSWLKHFNQDGDSLDWSKWEKWWAGDAFLQFGNAPRIDGKEAIVKHLEPQLNALELMHHEIIRLSFDKHLGLIYQTVVITYKVKGDPQERTIQVPGLGVLHKRIGEKLLTGFEIYVDKAPIEVVVKEVIQGSQTRE
ncbi:unnamed protein product [Rhizoctonia solani]|uniref:SnoaL-like domain-containing protein n=1 Tax=Rhizoctonia solani TaxID=456999 RepID=A0A8H3E1X7_9AGAM|nr:unnamed protein product [Rhizoctonia solani]